MPATVVVGINPPWTINVQASYTAGSPVLYPQGVVVTSSTWQVYPPWQTYPQQTVNLWGYFPPTYQTINGYSPQEHQRIAVLDDRAAARAKALLLEHLTEQQKDEYEQHRYFHVISQGGRVYRIKHGSVGNVYRIGLDGNEEAKFCIHASDPMPTEDNMLAQMILLRYHEDEFLATANRHW